MEEHAGAVPEQGSAADSSTVLTGQLDVVPGPRASKLQKIYAAATTHVLQTCNYKSFSSCFPTPAQAKPEVLRDLHRQFTADLGKQMQLNFDVILEDNEVVPRLNELDRLIQDAKRRRAEASADPQAAKTVPPHTLPADELYLAYLAPSLSQISTSLKEEQDNLSTENIQLLQDVMRQRKQIQEMVGGLQQAMSHLEQAATALTPEDVERLRNEVREADEEMRSTI